MDRCKASASFDPAAERRALIDRQGVAADVVPNRDIEALEVTRVEDRAVLGSEQAPAARLRHALERRLGGIDRRSITEPRSLFEDQHGWPANRWGQERRHLVIAFASGPRGLRSDPNPREGGVE